jgi:hypothetical protein
LIPIGVRARTFDVGFKVAMVVYQNGWNSVADVLALRKYISDNVEFHVETWIVSLSKLNVPLRSAVNDNKLFSR